MEVGEGMPIPVKGAAKGLDRGSRRPEIVAYRQQVCNARKVNVRRHLEELALVGILVIHGLRQIRYVCGRGDQIRLLFCSLSAAILIFAGLPGSYARKGNEGLHVARLERYDSFVCAIATGGESYVDKILIFSSLYRDFRL